MQKNPLHMTVEEIKRELETARRRVREDTIRALGSEKAAVRYERLRRRAEWIGAEGDIAFNALARLERSLTGTQRGLLFGDRRDARLDPDELEEVRRAFEPAIAAERPADLFPELRRNLPRVRPDRARELASLSGIDIGKHLFEIVAAIRVREALVRLRAFEVTGAGILQEVVRDFTRQGIGPEDAWFMLRHWGGSGGHVDVAGVGGRSASGISGQQGEWTW